MICQVNPYEGEQPFIFLSYCHKDEQAVYPIIEKLASEGLRIWYDNGIHPGGDWAEDIAHHLVKSHVVVAIITKAFASSHSCKKELLYTLENNHPVIPVMLEKFILSPGLKMQLSTIQQILAYELEKNVWLAKLLLATPLAECRGAAVAVKQAVELNQCNISQPESFAFDGNPHKWEPAVYYDGAALEMGKDYTLSYSTEDFAGIAAITVTITGIGQYSGTVTRDYRIEPAAEREIQADFPQDADFDGNAHKWIPRVTAPDGSLLQDGTDYEITYSTEDFVSPNEIRVVIQGIGTYCGYISRSYRICGVAGGGIRVDTPEDVEWDGSEHKWIPVVTDELGKLLIPVRDYEVIYSTGDFTGEGIIFAVVAAKEPYKGSVTRSYSIKPGKRSGTICWGDMPENAVSDGREHRWVPNITDGTGLPLKEGRDYTLIYSTTNFRDPGVVFVIATAIGRYEGSKTWLYRIEEQRKLLEIHGIPQDVHFDGAPHRWEPPVTDEQGNLLRSGADYMVTYSTEDFVSEGTVSVTVTGIGAFTGTECFTYQILPALRRAICVPNPENVFADGQPHRWEPVVTDETGTVLQCGRDYELQFSTGDFTQEGTVFVAVIARGGYVGTEFRTYQILPLPKEPIRVSHPADEIYDGQEHKWEPRVTDRENTLLTKGTDYIVSYSTEDFCSAGSTILVTVRGIGGYTGTETRTYSIIEDTGWQSEITVIAPKTDILLISLTQKKAWYFKKYGSVTIGGEGCEVRLKDCTPGKAAVLEFSEYQPVDLSDEEATVKVESFLSLFCVNTEAAISVWEISRAFAAHSKTEKYNATPQKLDAGQQCRLKEPIGFCVGEEQFQVVWGKRAGELAKQGQLLLLERDGGKGFVPIRACTIGRYYPWPKGLALEDPSVSRKHANLTMEHGQVVIENKSAYGSLLNGREILQATPLNHGDWLQFGDVSVKCMTVRIESGEKYEK